MNSNRVTPAVQTTPANAKGLEQGRLLNHQGELQYTTGAPFGGSDATTQHPIRKPAVTGVRHYPVVQPYQGSVNAPLSHVVGPVQHATIVKPSQIVPHTAKLTPAPASNKGGISKVPVKKWPTVISASEELLVHKTPAAQIPREVPHHGVDLVPTVNELPMASREVPHHGADLVSPFRENPIQLGRVLPLTNMTSTPLHTEGGQPTVNSAIYKVADIGQATVDKVADIGSRAADTAVDTAHKVADTTANVVSSAVEAGQNAADATSRAAQKVADTTANALSTAADVSSAALHKTADAVEVAENTIPYVLSTAADLGSAALHKTADAVEVVEKTAQAAKPAAASALATAADLGSAALHKTANAVEVVEEAAQAAGPVAASALHKAAQVAGPAAASALATAADLGSAALHKTADAVEVAENSLPYVADVARAAAGLGTAAAGLALHKAADVGQGALYKAADMGQAAASGAYNKAADLGQGALHAAADVGQAAASTTANVIYKAADLGQAAASGAYNKAAGLVHGAAGLARAAASGAYNKAAGLGNSMIQGVDDYVNHYISSTQRTWLKGQEEIEKLRRQTDEDEHWAMLNAFETAKCMRGWLEQINNPVPFSGRNAEGYYAKLLENVEMKRRCAHPTSAQKNAHKVVGMLINTRFNPHSDLCIPSLALQRIHKKDTSQLPSSSSQRSLPATAPVKTEMTASPLEGLSSAASPTPTPPMPTAMHVPPSLPAHEQRLASHSAPVHEDHVVPTRSVSNDNLQAPLAHPASLHHVPVSAMSAVPFAIPAGYPLASSGGNLHTPLSSPATQPFPFSSSGGLSQSGGLSYTIPPLPVLRGGSGNVVVFYPVMAPSETKDGSISNQLPLARPAM